MATSRPMCPICGGALRFNGSGGSMCPACEQAKERPSVRKNRELRPEPVRPSTPSPFPEIDTSTAPPPPPRPVPGRSSKRVRPFGPRDEADLMEYHGELDRQCPGAPTLTWVNSPELPHRVVRFGLKLVVVVVGSLVLKSAWLFWIGLAVLLLIDFGLPFLTALLWATEDVGQERVVVRNDLSVGARVDYEGKHLGKGSERVGPGKSIELVLERGTSVSVVDERTNALLHVDSIVRAKTIVLGGKGHEE